MKEYKQMWAINSNGDIEELAVSMITKAGWIKYYPVENGKMIKKHGIKEIRISNRFFVFTESFEQAKKVSIENKRNILNFEVEKQEEKLNKIPETYRRLEQSYIEMLEEISETKQSIETKINELKEKIKELEEKWKNRITTKSQDWR